MWRSILVVSFLPLVSCATISTGPRENIEIRSSPTEATATLLCDDKSVESGVTPTTIRIRRNAGNCSLKVAKDGFADQTIAIEQGVNPAYWMNFIFTPLAPAGLYVLMGGNSQEKMVGAAMLISAAVVFSTDFRTGAVHNHRPNKVDVSLKRKP